MRLIDADALKERAIRVSTVKEHCYFKAVGTKEIDRAPTVDAVEVVRCKDCIYYEETFGKDSGKPCGYGSCGCTCQIITGIIYDEDFCSYGERKGG